MAGVTSNEGNVGAKKGGLPAGQSRCECRRRRNRVRVHDPSQAGIPYFCTSCGEKSKKNPASTGNSFRGVAGFHPRKLILVLPGKSGNSSGPSWGGGILFLLRTLCELRPLRRTDPNSPARPISVSTFETLVLTPSARLFDRCCCLAGIVPRSALTVPRLPVGPVQVHRRSLGPHQVIREQKTLCGEFGFRNDR